MDKYILALNIMVIPLNFWAILFNVKHDNKLLGLLSAISIGACTIYIMSYYGLIK